MAYRPSPSGNAPPYTTNGMMNTTSLQGGNNPFAAPTATTLQPQQSSPIYNTLDEPVMETLMRDLRNIYKKLQMVLLPMLAISAAKANSTWATPFSSALGSPTAEESLEFSRARSSLLKDWDLWGPLLLCLALSIRLTLFDASDQHTTVFTAIFVLVWVGAGVVSLNSQLLGGRLSIWQSICVLGYCICPLVIVSFINIIPLGNVIRAALVLFSLAWSIYASVGFLSEVHLPTRRALAIYPICLFYFIMAWMVFIIN